MGLGGFFKRPKKQQNEEVKQDDPFKQGVSYVYIIVALQVLLVFGLLGGIMIIGKVISTPLWVFVAMGAAAVWGGIHISRRIKRRIDRLRQAMQGVDLSNRNYEISIMGGALTMRVEQGQKPPLLEAPAGAVVDAETVDTTITRQ